MITVLLVLEFKGSVDYDYLSILLKKQSSAQISKYRVTIKLLPFRVLPHSQTYCRDELYDFCDRLKEHAELLTKQNEHATICFASSSACSFNRTQKSHSSSLQYACECGKT